MLRGIRKASSNWLGKAGHGRRGRASWSSASRSGGSATFSAASAAPPSPRSEAPKSRSSSSACCTMIGCSNIRGSSAGRSARSRRGAGPGPAGDRAAGFGNRAGRARPGARSRTFRRRGRQADHDRSRLPGAEWPVRPIPVRADHPQCRLYRAAFCRRAAPPAAAPPARGHDRIGIDRSRRHWSRRPNRYQNEQRSIEYVLLDRAQAGEIPQPFAGSAGQILRGAQKFVPRARISQARGRVADPERAGAMDRNLRCGLSSAPTKSGAPAMSRRSGATSSRSIFPMPRRRSAAAERIAKGASFAEIAKELGKTEKDIDLGTVTKAGDHRPGGSRRRLRAQGRGGQRAGARPVRHRAGASAQDRARAGPAVRGRSPASSSRSLRPRVPRPRCSASTTRSRTRAPKGRRWPRPPRMLKLPARTIEAIDRSGRDPAGVPVSLPERSGCCRRVQRPKSASNTIRCRSRTATSGTR